ncbi:MAG: lipoyl(octanoyl) transferase LipB [Acidobacteria bacterium]|nr:lipoyl(octanoyl) transferase LipB [Acidobacteriota bacterium]
MRIEMEARLSPVETPAAGAVGHARNCQVFQLGRVPYRDAWALQRQWTELRRRGEIPDRLLLLEHPPVITLGRNALREHLLSSPEVLAAEGIEVVETNRGGDVTFHGPGQLVGYPILDLSRIRKDVVWYVRTLEEGILRTLQELDLAAGRRAGMTGVWVGESKVAAIGIHISRWITSHGFALNVETDLGSFRHIVPCGIAAYPVTSLRELLGACADRCWLEDRLAGHLGELLGLEMEWTALEYRVRRESCQMPMC